MKFLETFGIVLVICFVFAFFGGWLLFDINYNYYVATAALAFVIAVIVFAFVSLDEKVRQLEKRVSELEEKLSDHPIE